MKILITGSSGFIGFHLTSKLLKLGHTVIGVDDHNDYYDIKLKEQRRDLLLGKNFTFYKQDINEIAIKEKKIDIAINLAAQAGVRIPENKHYLYNHINVNGYKKFCNFCYSQNIKNIIYASSSSVYSDKNGGKFSEKNTKLEPKSEYGKSKLSNERFSFNFSNKTDTNFIGLRFFSVYGPYGRPDMAYFLFTELLKQNKKIILHNRGNMARDMTYIDDIVEGILSSIKLISSSNFKQKHEIINLGNNAPVTAHKLLTLLEKKLSKKSKIVYEETTNESSYTHADITKAKKILGYSPKVNLDLGIDRFLEWHNSYGKK